MHHLVTVGDQDDLIDEVEEFLVGSRRAHEPNGHWPRCSSPTSSAPLRGRASWENERWRHLLERHNMVVRRNSRRSTEAGEVKTLGGRFLATFDMVLPAQSAAPRRSGMSCEDRHRCAGRRPHR